MARPDADGSSPRRLIVFPRRVQPDGRVVIDRRRLAMIVGMWIAALAIIAGIYLTMEPAPNEGVVPIAGPIYGESDRAPQRSRRSLAVGTDEGFTHVARGGARNTGRSPRRGPGHPRRAWRYHAGGAISAQPIVAADGTIYVGTHRRTMHAVRPDGSRRWKRDVRGPVWSAAAAIGERAYVGSDDDSFFALERASGRVRWRIRTEGDADGSPSVAPDGTLRFTAGHDLFAADENGRVRWRFRARGTFLLMAPAIDSDGTAYVGSIDNSVYAVAADGRMRWKYRTGADVSSSPVIGDDGTIYIGSDDRRVHAIDRDGHRRWRTSVDGYVRAAVALGRDGSVIVAAYGPTPRVVALDADDGEYRWTFPIAIDEGAEVGIASSPLIDVDGNIYFGAQDGFVYSVTSAGRLRWIHRLGGDVDSSPILTREGLLLVGCDDGYLYAIAEGTE